MKLKIDSKKQTNYIVSEITKVCKTLPKREPGTIGEQKGCEYFAKQCKSFGCKTKIEHFKQHPAAFYGIFLVASIFILLTVGALFLFPLLGLIWSPAILLITVFQFISYIPVLDWFYPRKTGTNMTAIKPCKKEVKARIFFEGHVDAVWNFRLNYRFGPKFFMATVALTIIGAVFQWALCVASVCINGWYYFPFWEWSTDIIFLIGLGSLVFVPFQILFMFALDRKHIVDGAGDNLTGCLNGISILKALKDNHIDFNHVEVGVITAGSEEAGLKGAKAWAKAHKNDFNDVPTYIYCFDNISDDDWLMANYRDLNATVKTNKAMGDQFVKAGSQVGVKVLKGIMPPLGGSTDAPAYVKGGFNSICITALTHSLGPIYHTLKDTPENLNPKAIEECNRVTIQLLENFVNKYE